MLDSYIIDKIRRERDRSESVQTPLHIEVPVPPPMHDPRPSGEREEVPEDKDRGVVIIDFM